MYTSQEYAEAAISANKLGKQLIINDNNDLELTDIFRTESDIIYENTQKQQYLIDTANKRIMILQRAIKYNRATDDEKKLLERLELYTVEIAKVDTSDINAVFPDMPEQP